MYIVFNKERSHGFPERNRKRCGRIYDYMGSTTSPGDVSMKYSHHV